MLGQLSNRVLLVDDEPLVRKLISRYLVAAGYVVRMAEDGLDAIGKLRTGLPDLIISDLKMPRMSGLSFLTWCANASLKYPSLSSAESPPMKCRKEWPPTLTATRMDSDLSSSCKPSQT